MAHIRRWAVVLFAVGFLLSMGRTVALADQASSSTGDLGIHAGRTATALWPCVARPG